MFKQMVEQVLDVDGIKIGEYFIRASFDNDLKELKDAMDAIEEEMNREHAKVATDLNLDRGSTIKLELVGHLGYHFRIKDESKIRGNKKYPVLVAVKAGVRFTTEKLKDLNEKFSEKRTVYEEQQQSIVNEVIRVARKKFILNRLIMVIMLTN